MTKTTLLVASLVVLTGATFADSLFTQAEEESGTLVSEPKARFSVGDIITVIVNERVTASTTANTDTKKESTVDSKANAADNTFLVADRPQGVFGISPEKLPNWDIESENETKNSGTTKRTSALETTITCFVSKVLENDNLELKGEKQITVNREDSTIVLTGIVRAKDVTPANTVQSTQMAGTSLQLKGRGPVWNTQRRGFISKILDWFSPF